MAPVSSAARADAASLQCNLARVLGSSEFTNLIAACAVLISVGNLGAKPGGAFFSLIGMKGRRMTRSGTAGPVFAMRLGAAVAAASLALGGGHRDSL